jgi:hypothetical protein
MKCQIKCLVCTLVQRKFLLFNNVKQESYYPDVEKWGMRSDDEQSTSTTTLRYFKHFSLEIVE